ncbi:hypothetical protein [Sinimarinibacterium flocculans]|uniref:hypothetical protein n=1 Tax=Sinimarinibacterium flocculans TaxID=985250 RepID=UPI00351461CB
MSAKVDPFDSPKYRLEHAKRHAQAIRDDFAAFLGGKPYVLTREDDPGAKQEVLKIKLVKPLPSSIRGHADDAFGNLRSSLDQVGYVVARASGGRGKKCSFPFGDNETEARSRATGNSNELPAEIFDLMISFQPYAGGDDLLWALNEICNTGKHRLVRPVFAIVGGLSMQNVRLSGSVSIPGMWDSSKNEVVIATIGEGGSFSADDLQVSPDVVLDDIKVVGGQPVLGVFDALASKVERAITAVEAEGRRIGLFT